MGVNMHELGTIFRPEEHLAELRNRGATLLHSMVHDYYRRDLLAMAAQHEFYAVPEQVGPRGVRQQYTRTECIAAGSPLWTLPHQLETSLKKTFGGNLETDLPISFNELIVQRYREGALGIEPHRDISRYINLVVVCVLEGDGDLVICDDDGRPMRTFRGDPGDIILMRAPGLFREDVRPMHSVGPIRSERTVCTLRQRSRSKAA